MSANPETMSILQTTDEGPELSSLLAPDEFLSFFIAHAIPLRGCEYTSDDRMRLGRKLIFDWMSACFLASETEQLRIVTARERNVPAALYECSAVLYFLHNSEMARGARRADVGKYDAGRAQVIAWIEARLLRLSGLDAAPPHKTFKEKFDDTLAANPDWSATAIYDAILRQSHSLASAP